MTIYQWLTSSLWIGLIVFWLISAIGVKRSVGAKAWGKESGLRLILVGLILLALQIPSLNRALKNAQAQVVGNTPLGILGVVFCALGIGLAIWARVHLGRNWGLPMARKENPELVTTGPYALIRHPIYAGLLLAMLGSTIAQNLFWVLPLVLFGAYFVYTARREEKLMIELFPKRYPAYMQRTKMLLPFLL